MTRSTVTFSLGTKFDIGVQNTMIVQAKDSNGGDITIGGEQFYAKIMNQCTTGSNFEWVAISNRRNIVGATVFEKMNDHGNGTYTYDFTVSSTGNFTVAPMLYSQGYLYAEYFNNTACSGTHKYSDNPRDIHHVWNLADIYPGKSTNVWVMYHFALKGPVTENILFKFDVDDYAYLKIGDSYKNSSSFTKDQLYDWQIEYVQGQWWGSKVFLYWSYSGINFTIVPSEYFYNPLYVTGAPIQVESVCGTGFYETYSGGVYSCSTICGDGYRVGAEVCDDGNLVNGDGCSSTWGIETNWECGIQSELSTDICTFWGDGKKWGTEEWDDGNNVDRDGCSSTCKIEVGYDCWDGSVTTPSFWTICGDGIKHCSEEWDDRNYKSGDGCSFPNCKLELDHPYEYEYSPDDKRDIFTYCGDGIKYVNEEWDDKNNQDNDGWDSSWRIEDGWICISGSLKSRDHWYKWANGFKPNKDNTKCNASHDTDMIVFASFTLMFIGISFFIDLLYIKNSENTNLQTYSTIEYVQKILMLVLIGSHLPKGMLSYLRYISFIMFSFGTIGLIDESQTDAGMYHLGFMSNHAIFNISEYLLMFLLIVAIFFIWRIVKNYSTTNEKSWWYRYSEFLITSIWNKWTIRYFILGMNLVILSTVSEMKKYLIDQFKWSWWVSFLILSFYMWSIVLTLIYCVFSIKFSSPNKSELFRGLKKSKWARLYPFLTMLQKFIFAIILVLPSKSRPIYNSSEPESEFLSIKSKIGIMILMQTLVIG
jgi:cysteine-rich repeat protein